MTQKLIYNISELVTMAPLADEKRAKHITETDLGVVNNAWLLLENGSVKDFGLASQTPKLNCDMIDAKKSLVLPGLVDSHTHPVFGGSRYDEFAMRLNGVSYQEIAEKGGGIQSTVSATRAASKEELKLKTRKHLQTFLNHGVTTVEAKSGYGLSVKEELKMLEVLNELALEEAQELAITLLALHALPKEFTSYDAYVDHINKNLLPVVSEKKLARFVDAFVETGYFSQENCNAHLEAATKLGFKVRIHADEFTDANGAATAAHWKAASADHLQSASKEGIKAMAENDVTATILPGTSLYTAIPFTQARPFIDAGCPVAIATDFNPGSSLVSNLPMLTTIASLHCGFKTHEAIAGVTYVPARSLGLAEKKGALSKNFDADFIITNASSLSEWIADMGQTLPQQVWIKGQQVR